MNNRARNLIKSKDKNKDKVFGSGKMILGKEGLDGRTNDFKGKIMVTGGRQRILAEM